MAGTNEAVDTEGWTIVTHQRHQRPLKKRKQKSKKGSNKCDTSGRHQHDHQQQARNSDGLKLASGAEVDESELSRVLNAISHTRKKYRAVSSKTLDQLQSILYSINIRESVIVGLGNLDPSSPRDKWRAIWQLSVFLEIQALIPSSSSMTIYAQDPAFTAFDIALLAKLDIIVLPNNDAAERMDRQTFLFVPFVDAGVLLPTIIADRNIGLYVGTDMVEVVERLSMKEYTDQTGVSQEIVDEVLRVAKRFLEGMQSVDVEINTVEDLSLHGLRMFQRNA